MTQTIRMHVGLPASGKTTKAKELEKEGLVYSARTSGRFVTEDEKLIDQKRHEIAQSLMKNFVTEMAAIGFSSPEIKAIITNYIEQTGKDL